MERLPCPKQDERSGLPVCCGPMKTDCLEIPPIHTEDEESTVPGEIPQVRAEYFEASCVSLKRCASIEILPPKLEEVDQSPAKSNQQERSDPDVIRDVSIDHDWSMKNPPNYQVGQHNTDQRLNTQAFEQFAGEEIQRNLKSQLKSKFKFLCEGVAKAGGPTLLNEIYTELYITESGGDGISMEHEVRQIEAVPRRITTLGTPIKCRDIFNPLSGQDTPSRVVLTAGIAGIGKTVCVQKFALDWAEDKANQDISFIFPLPFRELNSLKESHLSLLELLHHFFMDIEESTLTRDGHKVLMIFDGLDECRFPLDIQNNCTLSDVKKSTTVDVLLTNLIRGNLLPYALIWITSRPAAANEIPLKYIDRMTEIRGFSDSQKEEYFQRRICDQTLADRIISHLKSSRTLFLMCHIPIFCWISATVLEKMLGDAEVQEIPKTLTQMYTHFLIIQTRLKQEKYPGNREMTSTEMIVKLGKLAFEQMMKGNLIFYEDDLNDCGIDVEEASVYSGLCTQIFQEEHGLHQSKVYCFVHLSIQEHLAAIHVFLSFVNDNTNVLEQCKTSKTPAEFACSTISDLHKKAVDMALMSRTGQLDVFLRFLLGISLESNQRLLYSVLTHTRIHTNFIEETLEYIKTRIRMNTATEKSINLFHCLNELNDQSLLEEIQSFQSSGRLRRARLSPTQWSALVFVLLSSEQQLDVFDLHKYSNSPSDESLNRLLPVVQASRVAELVCCNLTVKSFAALASALSSKSSNLRKVDISSNNLADHGLRLLSSGLGDSTCKLETLILSDNGITGKGCHALVSKLRLNPSYLRELDLSVNAVGDPGMRSLSDLLSDSGCKLEKLRLVDCQLRKQSCQALARALGSSTSLSELDLSENDLGDAGVACLSAGLKNQHCKLQALMLVNCHIESRGFESLSTALRLNPSHLRELCLNRNKPGDWGVRQISYRLRDPHCILEKLRLSYCEVTSEGFAALSEALTLNPSHLRELNLIGNIAGELGIQNLRAQQEHSAFRLEKLKI